MAEMSTIPPVEPHLNNAEPPPPPPPPPVYTPKVINITLPTILPALVIFALDYKLYPFRRDRFPYFKKDAQIIFRDKIYGQNSNEDNRLKLNAHVPAILDLLRDYNIKIAVCYNSDLAAEKFNRIIQAKQFDQILSFIPNNVNQTGAKQRADYVKYIHETSGIPYNKIIYFDSNRKGYVDRNFYDFAFVTGLLYFPVSGVYGITIQNVGHSLNLYAEKEAETLENQKKS